MDSHWYSDSGATNHLSRSFSNLSTRSEYGGENQIYAANGSSFLILHYGSSFPSCTMPSKSLILNNLLHIPSITKNLISVSQFAKDNDVFSEFHPKFCYVKDRVSGQILLRRLLHEGLYQFTITPSHKNNVSDANKSQMLNVVSSVFHVNSVNLWHKRLGHPHISVIQSVFKNVKNPSMNVNKL